MAQISLQQALTNNATAIGTNYEHLGKKKEIYLSYDATKGWSVIKFEGCWGFIQSILRYIGFYASTRIKTVAAQIQQEAGVPPALLAKIHACWSRHGGPVQPAAPAAPAVPAAPVAPAAPAAPAALPPINEARVHINPDPANENRFGFYLGADHHTLLSFEQGDILRPGTAAIVNAANMACLGGGGVDGAIHRAAGPALLAECRTLPEIRPNVRCDTGHAVITKSGNLEQNGIHRIIHAVGPIYDASTPAKLAESAQKLRQTYTSALEVARQNGIRTIAFPAISTGVFGYPLFNATREAAQEIRDYVDQHPGHFNEIKLLFVGNMFGQTRDAMVGLNLGIRDNFMQV